LVVPPSPEVLRESERLLDDEQIDDQVTEEMVQEKIKEHEAKIRAVTLELIGDIPDADVKPPENVAFVCKLHPVTNDQDLFLLFSRFGPINSCQVIRDFKTGQSLQYAFIEFQNVRDCEEAVLKMDGVLVDRKRIKVDFSQSVSKIWNKHRQGRRHLESKQGIEIKKTLYGAKSEQDRHKLVFEFQDLPKKRGT
jgi:peptidyl-prolyl cis-trans isomerase-like 4